MLHILCGLVRTVPGTCLSSLEWIDFNLKFVFLTTKTASAMTIYVCSDRELMTWEDYNEVYP